MQYFVCRYINNLLAISLQFRIKLLLICFLATVNAAFVPTFTAPMPDPSKPLGGYSQAKKIFPPINIAYANQEIGKYNHNVMINYDINLGFYIYWKNGLLEEDSNGQRVLFSATKNVKHFFKTPRVLFPNLTIANIHVSLEPSPSIQINGRVYATASPAYINYTLKDLHVAQGAQCQLWPDSIDPRNCGPAATYAVEYKSTLLLRRIYSNFSLGKMFWGSFEPPAIFSMQTQKFGIQTYNKMDKTTYNDLRNVLQPNNLNPPCNSFESGSTKCEWCKGGCMLFSRIPYDLKITNERSYYHFDSGNMINNKGDVLLYRSGNTKHLLYASVRRNNSNNQDDWSDVYETNIPNVNSNLNSGALSNGKKFLAFNPVVRDNKTLYRDPLCLATSSDGGKTFNKVAVALTCHELWRSDNNISSCMPLFNHTVNYGVSYPQALTVNAPAPVSHQGFYIAASNNKEDIWLVKLDIEDL
eukprot:g68.t1